MQRKSDGVYLTSNGPYWMAVWYDNNGRRIRKSIGPKSRWSKTAANAQCNRIAAGHIVQPGTKDLKLAPTLEAWQERYFKIRSDISDGTRTIAGDTFRRLTEFYGARHRIDRITRAAASDFRTWLAEQPGRKLNAEGDPLPMSEQTVARYIRDCKVIFAWAYREDLIQFNPFDRINSGGGNVVKDWAFVTREQLEQIIEACPSDGWRCLFSLCRLAGLRYGEAIRLEWADIDWNAKMLWVRPPNGIEDTKHSRRDVPIMPKLLEILRESFEAAPAKVARVCNVPTNNQIRDALVIIRRAGVPEYAKPFHTLRKNLESEWLAEFPLLAVCEWLGHSPQVAAQHYHRPTAAVVARVTSAPAGVAP